jgi:hypothetical protein
MPPGFYSLGNAVILYRPQEDFEKMVFRVVVA